MKEIHLKYHKDTGHNYPEVDISNHVNEDAIKAYVEWLEDIAENWLAGEQFREDLKKGTIFFKTNEYLRKFID